MAKLHIDRLIKKYNLNPSKGDWTGDTYRELMEKIIAHNSEQMSKAVFRLNNEAFRKERKKVKETEKAFVMPNVSDVLPKRSVFIKKGAEKGKLINQTLRDRLTSDLREVLKKSDYLKKRGPEAGLLKKEVLEDFQRKIIGTFKSYTKVDPSYGIPANIKAIVSTEVKGTVNPIKQKYMESFSKKNPDTVMKKTWVHVGNVWKNPDYVPRSHHEALNGVTIYLHQNFTIRGPKGVYKVPYPHHESLPPEEVIACNCELKYIVRKRK